jgi:hypothetical protein
MQITVYNFAGKVRVSAITDDYNYQVRRGVLKEPKGEKENYKTKTI